MAPKRAISERFSGMDWQTQVVMALDEHVSDLVEQTFQMENGEHTRIDKIFIDVNWGEMESKLVQLCREHKYAAMIVPTKGRGIKARDRPLLEQWKQEPGEERGLHWIRRRQERKGVKILFYDSDFWKTKLHVNLSAPNMAAGSVTIFQGTEHQHELFYDHILAENETKEASVKTGRTQHEWTQPPECQNHWHDCVVMCLIGANSEGAVYGDQSPVKRTRVKRVRFPGR